MTRQPFNLNSMHSKNHLTAGLIVLAVLFTAITCDRKGNAGKNPYAADTTGGVLRLSPLQMEQAGIETGKVEYRDMGGTLECKGFMEAQPEHIADVTAPWGDL